MKHKEISDMASSSLSISEETLSILSNLSTINQGIVIKEGSDFSTISEGKNILARASVDEYFPCDFAIYQLNEFLSAVSLLDEPEFHFNESSVKINAGNARHSVSYGYADPTLVTQPPMKRVEFPDDGDVEFEIKKDDLKTLLKASGAMHLPHICIQTTKAAGLVLAVTDRENPKASNAFELELDEKDVSFSEEFSESDLFENYGMTFKVDNIILFPGDYTVKISNKGIGHFVNKDVDVEYWISAEHKYSTISE
tara:strand:+ start:646 stop:1407 length:762 start_codon:yes stop_codon:yes gene_type:complete